MNPEKQHRIRQALQDLVRTHVHTIQLMEETLSLLNEELSRSSARNGWSRGLSIPKSVSIDASPLIDPVTFTLWFGGRSCFIGNSLPYRFFCRLAQRPNTYVSHEVLLDDVWDGIRSNAAIRSVVKILRAKLRAHDMGALAAAIESVPGHYSLRLDKLL